MTSQIKNNFYNNKAYQIHKNNNHLTTISESATISKEFQSTFKQKKKQHKGSQKSIEEFHSQNQYLKSQIRKLRVRQNHLQNKLKIFLSEEEINLEPIQILDQNEQKIKELEIELSNKRIKIRSKYQKEISTLLECYGCTKQETNIKKLNNQNEIIEFIINKFHEKAKELRRYDQDMNKKIKQLNQEILELKGYIKQINSSMHLKQQKYKETFKQLKQDWLMVCEKLSKKDLQIEKVYRQPEQIKLKMKQQEQKINKMQNRIIQLQEENLKLQNRNYEISHKNSQNTLNFQEIYDAYEQSQIRIKQFEFKQRNYEQQKGRLLRQLIRYKQRHQFVQKRMFESGDDIHFLNTSKSKQKSFLEEKLLKHLSPTTKIMQYDSFRTFSPFNQNANQFYQEEYNESQNQILNNSQKVYQIDSNKYKK